MNQILGHLPEFKRDELKHIVSVIHQKSDDVEMIILFGSYARGDYKVEADLQPDRKSGHVSDYDILVVTGQKKTVFSCWTMPISAPAMIQSTEYQKKDWKLLLFL
ncbi:MAG: nucleotidyltransferase domain-containing protein [Candidatus Thiodiazotropha sp. (ex Dulcina madagascariensis)]|nr:nucleotidyltransferase domain-containing protein [Candidatus Thiodiazotropha sp. (ex Dulcina madagascariensis)]